MTNYDYMTDAELIRHASGYDGLIQALAERLDMRQQPQSVFHDQATFMRACGQTVGRCNRDQADLYKELVYEELHEWSEAIAHENEVEEFDAVLDVIVVLIGYGLSRGWPMPEGWHEVMRSNLAKIDPATGLVRRRADGKVLKPEGWQPPDLDGVLGRYRVFNEGGMK